MKESEQSMKTSQSESRPCGYGLRVLPLILGALAGLAFEGKALTVTTIGTRSSVTTADRTATFDCLTKAFTCVDCYTEGGLTISEPELTFVGFDAFGRGPATGFYYGGGGNRGFVSITTTDSREIQGLEFLYGNGFFADQFINTCWETWKDGSMVGSGYFEACRGTVVGWNDPAGFDELRVAAGPYLTRFGGFQAVALDNLCVQLAAAPSPSPHATPDGGASVLLLGLSCLALVAARGRLRAS